VGGAAYPAGGARILLSHWQALFAPRDSRSDNKENNDVRRA